MNVKCFRYGLCVLASLACTLIFGGRISHAADAHHEMRLTNSTYSVAKAAPTAKPGTWEKVDDPQGSGSVKSSDGKSYYQSAKYKFNDGGYANNQWVYAYDENGGGPYWYWVGPDGFRTYGWQYINGKGYFLGQTQGKWNESWDYSHELNSIKGVDVSYWQKDIDWTAFREAGYDFAFVRVGYGYSSYHDQLDSYYRKNMENADAAGIATGVYYYSVAKSQTQAVTDARFIIKNMQGYNVSYPVVIDLEDESTQGTLPKEQLTEIVRAFCDEIQKAGYTPMIYVNYNWYTNHLDMSKLSDIDVWLATYSSHHSYSIDPDIWQCGSTAIRPDQKNYDSGSRIDYVDINFGYKDYRTIVTPRKFCVSSYSLDKPSWHKDSGGWWLYLPNGTIARNSWQVVDGKTYRFNGDGYLLYGSQEVMGNWYYFKSTGAMAQDEWIDGKYYGKDGIYDPDHPIGKWIKTNGRWWYKHYDGSYTKNNWEKIEEKWYYFDKDGWMKTGWLKLGNYWYYLDEKGVLQTGWISVNNIFYYAEANGRLKTNCWIDNLYYLGANGAYTAKKTNLGIQYLGTWETSNDKFIFRHNDGTFPKSKWEMIKDNWFYFDDDGYCVTGWLTKGTKTYYLGTNGILHTGWILADNVFYYAVENGVIQKNCWIFDQYYLGENGIYTAKKTELGTQHLGSWKRDGEHWKFINRDGTIPVDTWELIEEKWYFFDENGYMATDWVQTKYGWYYLGKEGYIHYGWFEADGEWYYANANGKMLRNTTIDGFYITPSGISYEKKASMEE